MSNPDSLYFTEIAILLDIFFLASLQSLWPKIVLWHIDNYRKKYFYVTPYIP